ncbi:MAG: cadmium-translocating P-type ATPase [Selenomonadaceae bacterium]|nr:cadmium-translocating P-type ATPase [Selenomonadaceae bacterium]
MPNEHSHEHEKFLEPRIRIAIAIILFIIGIATYGKFSIAAMGICYLWIGWDVLLAAWKNVLRGIREKDFSAIFDEQFLMSIASLGAIYLHEFMEAAAVMLFYQIGEYFQDQAVDKSRDSIQSLMKLRPDSVTTINGEKIEKKPPDEVSVGEFFIVKPGERIPLDGVIINGSSSLDTSALTGESYPRRVSIGDEVLSGCINKSGALTIRSTKISSESTVEKILELVEKSGERKAQTEAFITKFARIYTPVVTMLAVLLAIIPPIIFDAPHSIWIYRALTFLVISCPCALVISVPLSFFGGIGGAGKSGILVKGGTDLEKLASLNSIVFDKTGTLTQGKFSVTSIETSGDPSVIFERKDILKFAALAEIYSNHPIALSIKKTFESSGGILNRDLVSDVEEIAGHGIRAMIQGKKVVFGNEKFLEENGIDLANRPINSRNVGIFLSIDGKFVGTIKIEDALRSDAEKMIAELKDLGIDQTVMLSGDRESVASEVSNKLRLSEFHAELLPQDKVAIVEKMIDAREPGKFLAFVGDGMNDAPSLARADVGIAMGSIGTDAAIEAADVVLMTDELSKIPLAVRIARKTMNIARQNIFFSLGVKFAVLILGALGIASLWAAVFADVGVAVLAALNAMRTLSAA